jgi:NADPH:quinone reductase-like Zn-dependent oxidoreductase
MNAVQIADYGGADAVFYGPFPEPSVQPGQVLVRVVAAGVNPVDWKVRQGVRRANIPLELPAVLGCDFSGVVEAVGAEVRDFRPGEAVFGMTGLHGAFSDHVAVDAAQVAAKPAALDHVHAAAVPLAALTAWQALKLAGLAAGGTVLIHAAAGGVGGYAVQIARALGARVIGTASAGKLDYVRRLGAEAVIDYRATRFEDVVHDVDVVLDLIGGETQDRSWAVLKPGGFLVTAVAVPAAGDPRPGGRPHARVGVRAVGEDLKQIAALIEQGRLEVHVARTYPMAEAAAAIEQVGQGHTQGKVVLVA